MPHWSGRFGGLILGTNVRFRPTPHSHFWASVRWLEIVSSLREWPTTHATCLVMKRNSYSGICRDDMCDVYSPIIGCRMIGLDRLHCIRNHVFERQVGLQLSLRLQDAFRKAKKYIIPIEEHVPEKYGPSRGSCLTAHWNNVEPPNPYPRPLKQWSIYAVWLLDSLLVMTLKSGFLKFQCTNSYAVGSKTFEIPLGFWITMDVLLHFSFTSSPSPTSGDPRNTTTSPLDKASRRPISRRFTVFGVC